MKFNRDFGHTKFLTLPIVAGFTRYHKYTLGSELRNKSRQVVALIVSM